MGGQHNPHALLGKGVLKRVLQTAALYPGQQSGQGFHPLQIVQTIVSRVLQRIHQHHLTLDVLNEAKQQAGPVLLRHTRLIIVRLDQLARGSPSGQRPAARFLKQRHLHSCTPNAVEWQGQKNAIVHLKRPGHRHGVGRVIHGSKRFGEPEHCRHLQITMQTTGMFHGQAP